MKRTGSGIIQWSLFAALRLDAHSVVSQPTRGEKGDWSLRLRGWVAEASAREKRLSAKDWWGMVEGVVTKRSQRCSWCALTSEGGGGSLLAGRLYAQSIRGSPLYWFLIFLSMSP